MMIVLTLTISIYLYSLFSNFGGQEGAFAQLKVWQSASIAVVFFLSPYISLHAMLVLMIVALCVSFAGFLFLTLQVERSFSS